MTTSFEHTPAAEDHDPEMAALDDILRRTLQRVWGFSAFRPLQREAMHAVLSSRDSLVVLPTGGGKSLCFQAPAVVDPGEGSNQPASVALVVSPLISLMKDQVDGLRADGIEAAYLNSTLSPQERTAVLEGVRGGRYRLVYVSPERIAGDGSVSLRRMLRQAGVRFVAIDEAHCISQWGHDFRPEYRQLGMLRDDFPGVAFHAFTATATHRVQRDIVSELRLQRPEVLVGSFDRPNLTYRVLRRGSLHHQLTEILARHENEAGIVYCTSRREVDALATWLDAAGLRAAPYHAGMDDALRSRHQDAFLDEHIDIIVATVAFGMGIDRSNVRFVVHSGAPRSLEHYQQESGRAGRDGLPAECVLLYSGADFLRWRQMLEANGEWNESARTLLRDMERYAAGPRCRHRALVEYFGQTLDQSGCGACDWCLRELQEVPDSVTIARKVLSCVARVRQTWGASHVADVLLGRGSEKIVAAGHDKLTTFGLLREEPAAAIRGYIEQLVGNGLLARDKDPYPVLRITTAGAALLKGRGECTLFREVAPPSSRRRPRSSISQTFTTTSNSELFDRLREVRLRLARERGVPPYVIFHDTSLRDMAERRPKTFDELRGIYGVGAKKATDFGDAFLDVIRAFGGR
jgi:ATP-dependent DNA helicase RecQ